MHDAVPGPEPTEFGAVSGSAGSEWMLSFASVAPEDVVSAAVRGMLRGRRSVIPGVAPRRWRPAGRLAPRSVLLPAARKALTRR